MLMIDDVVDEWDGVWWPLSTEGHSVERCHGVR